MNQILDLKNAVTGQMEFEAGFTQLTVNVQANSDTI